MKKIKKLCKLIHAMNASEKRYFKKYHSFYSPNASTSQNYVNLFDKLLVKKIHAEGNAEANEVYSKAFREQHKNEISYLYQVLLRILRAYEHRQESPFFRIRELEMEAQILRRKRLNDSVFEVLNEAAAIAEKNKMWAEYMSVLRQQRDVVRVFKNQNRAERLIDLDEKRLKVLAYYEEENRVGNVLEKIFLYFKAYQRLPEDMELLRQELPQAGSIANYSYDLQFQINFILALYYSNLKPKPDLKQAMAYHNCSMQLFKEQPQLLHLYEERYFNLLNNLCNCYVKLGKIKEMATTIDALEEIIVDESFAIRRFNNLSYNKMLYQLMRQDYQAAYNLRDEIKAGLERFERQITPSRRTTFYYYLGISSFAVGKHMESLHWLRPLTDKRKSKVAKKTWLNALLFEFINQYETNVGASVISALWKSLRQKLVKEFTTDSDEYRIADTIRKASKLDLKPAKQKELFFELHEQLKDKPTLDIIVKWLKKKW